MHGLIAVQVAFCFLVHFAAGLFWSSFDRMTSQPLGFNTQNLWVMETVSVAEEPMVYWESIAEQLRQTPGVESAALCSWAVMSGNGWSGDVMVNGGKARESEPYFLGVSPSWLETMKIGLKSGRDFRAGDIHPRVAIVNEKFAQEYFDGQDPVGKFFETSEKKGRVRTEIIGLAKDARYRNLREKLRATVYVPFAGLDEKGEDQKKDWGTYVVRLADGAGPAVAGALRATVKNARSGFRVGDLRTQQSLVDQHTVRERLLATLGGFFAVVALLLAAVGLYGVLDYSVQQRRREIGIRMALGAQPGDLARRVTSEVFLMLALGSAGGLALGLGTEQYLETLLYGVKATDWQMIVGPLAILFGAALLAAVPPVIRAVRFDPAMLLRAE
jgi:predicted permease